MRLRVTLVWYKLSYRCKIPCKLLPYKRHLLTSLLFNNLAAKFTNLKWCISNQANCCLQNSPDDAWINSPFRVLPLRDFDWNSKQFVYLIQCTGSTERRINVCVWRSGVERGVRVFEYWAWSTNWDIALRSSWSKSLSEVPPAGFVFSGPHFDYCPLYELVAFLQLGTWRQCVLLEKRHWDTFADIV